MANEHFPVEKSDTEWRTLLNAELAEVKRTQAATQPVSEAARNQAPVRTGLIERRVVSPTHGPKMDPHDPMNPTL